MGALFGGGQQQAPPPVQQVSAPVRRVAPTGPQLAPGQSVPGGPVVPPRVETEEERRNRLLRAQNNTILGDSGVFNDAAGNSVDSGANDGVGGAGEA